VNVVPGVFSIGIGVAALCALRSNRRTRTEMLSWPSVEGRITARTLERRTSGSAKAPRWVYTPAFRYTYAVDGVEHTGDTRSLSWKSGWSKRTAERKLYEVPDDVPVLYDPADPSKSALEPPGSGDIWFWAAFGAGLIALGLYFLFS
jgi:hypothetical protein